MTLIQKTFGNKQRVLIPPLPIRVATAGKNHLNKEITPSSASDIAKPYQI
jgi:hypothetical protein